MIVDVNTDFLINNKVTADQYMLMSLILAEKFNILKDYYLINNIDIGKVSNDIKYLHDKGLIEGYTGGSFDLTGLKATKYLKNLFNADDLFKEFLGAFPLKVTRTDGTVDYLRTDQSKCKLLYIAHTRGKKSKHDHILKCLQHEINYREANGSMKFMKRMSTWLSSREWESFEDQIDDLGNLTYKDKDLGYGTELI